MKVGSICYATSQGLGHLAKSFFDAGIINEVMVFKHPHGDRPSRMDWYPKGTIELKYRPFIGEKIERFLDDIDIMLFFETPFDWNFPQRCHERGVKTAIIPMYEWFLQHPTHQFDLFLNPSLLDQYYFPHGTYIPIPVEEHVEWDFRKTAKKFLHNAGNIGSRNHKGTQELLRAMQYVKSPIELSIRCQDKEGLLRLIESAPGVQHDDRIQFIFNEIPRELLFKDHDVYIAPEKYNGLSLPLQEAFASGLMVMTTNRFPTNQWLPSEPLIPPSGSRKAQTMRGHLEFEETIVDPQKIAEVIDQWYGEDIKKFSLLGREYREENSWKNLRERYLDALENLL